MYAFTFHYKRLKFLIYVRYKIVCSVLICCYCAIQQMHQRRFLKVHRTFGPKVQIHRQEIVLIELL